MISNNSLAFIALANEYCQALEGAGQAAARSEFVASMLRLLPRIYIAATDLAPEDPVSPDEEDSYIEQTLDEEYYDSVRRAVERLMEAHDTYLEVFEEDMKYSDSPIAASISENLADIFQVLFNFTEQVKNQPADLVDNSLRAVKEDFEGYWSRPLCNVLRALNAVRYSSDPFADDGEEF